jgi:FkbM family methyltransferase
MDMRDVQDFLLCLQFKIKPQHNRAIASLIQSALSEGCTFVDAGANVGHLTLAASKVVGRTGCVYAFEPGPGQSSRLARNLAINECAANVETFPYALSDFDGTSTLYQSYFFDGSDSMVRRSRRGIAVGVRKLDSVIRDAKVDLIKIDVEGQELSVLKGAKNVLQANPQLRLIIEWNAAYATTELWKFLAERFIIRPISERDSGFLGPVVGNPSGFRDVCNLWCVPLDSTRK